MTTEITKFENELKDDRKVKQTEPSAEEKIIAELKEAAYYVHMSKGTSQFEECKAKFEKILREYRENKDLDIPFRESNLRNIVTAAIEKAENDLAMLPSCSQRLINMFDEQQQTANVFNNPHDSHVMQAAAGEIFTQTTKTNEAIQKIEEAEPFVLTIEEPKAKLSKTGKARKNRSKKAIERVMDSVCENLFPEVTAVAISKPAKTKTINKKRRYSKKDTEKLMNSVCADLFEEFTKGLNLFAA